MNPISDRSGTNSSNELFGQSQSKSQSQGIDDIFRNSQPMDPDPDPDSAEANGGGTFVVVSPTKNPPSPSITVSQFERILEKSMTRLSSEIGSAVTQIQANSTNIQSNRDEIKAIREDIAELKQSNSAERMRDIVASVVGPESFTNNTHHRPKPLFQAGARNTEQEASRLKKYALSRSSLRIWPIPGNSNGEISTSLRGFLTGVLGIAREDVTCLGIKWIERTRSAPKARVKDEIRVTFNNQFLRDEMAAKGRMLANMVDSEGNPTAGFRLDVPDYLAADFKTLTDYGYRMRRVHGKETKRHVLGRFS